MNFRALPSVDQLLNEPSTKELIANFGRQLTLDSIREQLETARNQIRGGQPAPSTDQILAAVRLKLDQWLTPSLKPVINATGVIIHTNLGRAPLSPAAREAMRGVSHGYSALEYDLITGKRGQREGYVENLLCHLTGAEAALVVNNNAAALLLALTGLAQGEDVIISRSQLIEIGGGFRIPDVMMQSGARLVEVGTTNRTHLRDYELAIHEETALILRAHHSNFRIIGFATEPSLQELVDLGKQHAVPVMDDLGSGALLDTADFGLGHEPTVQESLATGAALVAFSGDKLLGGPQAGILLGEEAALSYLRHHPLTRAVRADKLCLAGLTATLHHYLKEEALEKIPVWQMIAAPIEEIHGRALRWAEKLGGGEVVPGRSTVGGGSLPEETLTTWLLAIPADQPDSFVGQLREANPPVIARIEDDQVMIDPRTVLPEQEQDLLRILSKLLGSQAPLER
jgi:L-seryl-tRNA(Ser) seleniumtransferase